MKLLKLYSLFVVLIFTSISFGQEFQLGIRLEGNHFNTTLDNYPYPSTSISTAQILGTVFFNENIGIDARLGFDWSDFYKGGEAGLFSKYYYNDLYAVGGVVYHHIRKDNNISMDQSVFVNETDLFMPALGLGYNPGRHFAVELMLQHGLNKKVGEYHDWLLLTSSTYHPFDSMIKDIKVTWITKLGISYSFSL